MNHWIDHHAADHHPEALRIALAFASAGLAGPAIGMVCSLGGDGDGVGGGIQDIDHDVQSPWQSIAAFCGRDDLPDFDVIALHYPWSRLPPGLQDVVVDFVRRKLRAGGVFAVNYHCQPGWAPMAPVRSLLAQTATTMSAAEDHSTGSSDSTGIGDFIDSTGNTDFIDRTLDFADRLLATNPAYFGAYPRVAERLRSLRAERQPSLARNYFSAWQPVSFAEMADVLGEAKLTFACPADILDHLADLHLTLPQQQLLAELSDPVFAESVRDLMVNRRFRADYWVKGARPLSPLQKAEAMRRPSVILATPHAPSVQTIAAPLPEAVHLPLLPLLNLMADRQPRTIGELAAALESPEIALRQVFDAVLVLVGTGQLTIERA